MGRGLKGIVLALASALFLVHGAGWAATVVYLWDHAALYVPRVQSALVLAFALVALRSTAAPRRTRRWVLLLILMATAVAFVAAPFPQRFNERGVMPGGATAAESRGEFDTRFAVSRGHVQFHSHLGDVAMDALDRAFGRSDASPSMAYATLSRLAGLLFLLELGLAAAWHRWSRRSCRFAGLALATPVSLLYFGYWELGYLAVAAGVVPILAFATRRTTAEADAATLVAGSLQGLHTALYGFGLFGLAGGTLAALTGKGSALRRFVRASTFASAGVAFYLGWIFLYVALAGLTVDWARQVGYRPLLDVIVFDHRYAQPLMSLAGLSEFGMWSILAGVPVLGLAALMSARTVVIPALLFGLPAMAFLIRWWPVSAPFNLDLLLSVFPGVLAACWVLASTHRKSLSALVLLALTHVALWTTLGGGLFERVWEETSRGLP